jgi:hypothetical protein
MCAHDNGQLVWTKESVQAKTLLEQEARVDKAAQAARQVHMVLAHNPNHECKLAKIEHAVTPIATARAQQGRRQGDDGCELVKCMQRARSLRGVSVLLEGRKSPSTTLYFPSSKLPSHADCSRSFLQPQSLGPLSGSGVELKQEPAGRVCGLKAFALVGSPEHAVTDLDM